MNIKCPECGKDISNQSENCIYCGYPIIQNNNAILDSNMCIIDGVQRDLSEYIKNLNNDDFRPFIQLVEEYDMSLADASILWRVIETTKKIPKEYNSCQREEYKAEIKKLENFYTNIPKCPTCGATNVEKIGGLERGASVAMWGLFSKKINKTFKCKNCGYTW